METLFCYLFLVIKNKCKHFPFLSSNSIMRLNHGKISDEEFITGLQSGNEYFFSLLMDRYKTYVLNICYKFLFNREDAEDTAQEVFAEIYLSIAKFRRDSSLSTWIYQVAVRKSLDLIRKKNRKKRIGFLKNLVGIEEAADEPSGNEYMPDEILNTKQMLDIFRAAMEKLPESQRIAFALSKMEDMNIKEITGIMNLSEQAVVSILHRAKVNLREILKNIYSNESFIKK